MTHSRTDSQLHVVIAGAGVAGLEAMIALRQLARDRVALTMLAPEREFVYKPLSVGDPFALGPALHTPVAEITLDFNADLIRDGLAAVDADAHNVTLTEGQKVAYDRLIVAVGAERVPVYEHVMTFRGQEDAEPMHGLVQDVEGGYARKIAFVVPPGVAWSLPLYELALMTARRAYEMSAEAELTFVTPEERPLAVFGPKSGADVRKLLEAAGIRLVCSTAASVFKKGGVLLRPSGEQLEVDRVVTLPVVRGRPIPGLPSDGEGFLPIDSLVRVAGVPDVYAAGDGTDFPLKQGGIACQQADVAAEEIAREAGVPLQVQPFRPVLRGQLMTGGEPHFMRRDVSGRAGDAEESGAAILWWPPSKVAGKYLAPYLAARDKTAGAAPAGTEAVELHGYEFASR